MIPKCSFSMNSITALPNDGGSLQKIFGCGTWGRGLGMWGWCWLDLVILEIFPNISGFRKIPHRLCVHIPPPNSENSLQNSLDPWKTQCESSLPITWRNFSAAPRGFFPLSKPLECSGWWHKGHLSFQLFLKSVGRAGQWDSGGFGKR